MARLIVLLIYLIIQLGLRVIRPLARNSKSYNSWTRRIQALKSDLSRK